VKISQQAKRRKEKQAKKKIVYSIAINIFLAYYWLQEGSMGLQLILSDLREIV